MIIKRYIVGSTQRHAFFGKVESYAPCVTASAGTGGGQLSMFIEIHKAMKKENTIESAREWVESGKPCIFRYGWRYRGACARTITKEKALEKLNSDNYSFGDGFWQLSWTTEDGKEYLEFNELSENDMW